MALTPEQVVKKVVSKNEVKLKWLHEVKQQHVIIMVTFSLQVKNVYDIYYHFLKFLRGRGDIFKMQHVKTACVEGGSLELKGVNTSGGTIRRWFD